MYEWHGWATLSKTPTVDYDDDLDRETLSTLRALLAKSDTTFNETADLRSANGEWHVWLAGCHNHRTPAIVGLFRAIAREVPGSYGILYTFDDEVSDGWDRWVMRHGGVQKTQDEDLSPHVGVVEDSEEPGQQSGLAAWPTVMGRQPSQGLAGCPQLQEDRTPNDPMAGPTVALKRGATGKGVTTRHPAQCQRPGTATKTARSAPDTEAFRLWNPRGSSRSSAVRQPNGTLVMRLPTRCASRGRRSAAGCGRACTSYLQGRSGR